MTAEEREDRKESAYIAGLILCWLAVIGWAVFG